MAINWDCLKKPSAITTEAEVIKRLEERGLAQADANQRQLEEAKAADVKRRRIEEIQASRLAGKLEE